MAPFTEDAGAYLTVKSCDPAPCLSEKDTLDVLAAISEPPHGVIRRQGDGVVTSSNTGVVRLEGGELSIDIKPRSAYQEEMDALSRDICTILEAHGVSATTYGMFP